MADKRKQRRRSVGFLAGAAVIGAAAGVALERAVVGRVRSRPDPEAGEPFGLLRGTPIGPIESFDGTALNVEVTGTGPTVVFSHGYSLDLTSWHYQIRDLSNEYRLVLYDQRGHGRSEPAKDGDWSLEALARDLERVIRASGPEPVTIVAHSMGGMAAIKFAELFPEMLGDRVIGLVLVDTTAAEVVKGLLPAIPARLSGAVNGLQEVAMRALVSLDRASVDRMRRRASDLAWLVVRAMGFGSNASPAQVAFVERMLHATPVETWFELLPTMAGMDQRPGLASIDVPTLVMVGASDRLTPPAAAERLAASIKGAELAKIGGAGHCPMIEAAATFSARLRLFLSGLPWPERRALETGQASP